MVESWQELFAPGEGQELQTQRAEAQMLRVTKCGRPCFNGGAGWACSNLCGRGSRHKGKCLCPRCFEDGSGEIRRGVAAIDEAVLSVIRSHVNCESRSEVVSATAQASQQASSSGQVQAVEEVDAGGSSLPSGDAPPTPFRGGCSKRGGGRGAGGKAGAGKSRTAHPAAHWV